MCTITEVIAAGYTPNTETSTLGVGGGGKCLTVNAFLTNFKKEGYELSITGRDYSQLFPLNAITETIVEKEIILKVEKENNDGGWQYAVVNSAATPSYNYFNMNTQQDETVRLTISTGQSLYVRNSNDTIFQLIDSSGGEVSNLGRQTVASFDGFSDGETYTITPVGN